MPARPLRVAAPWFVLVLGLALTGLATTYVSTSSTRVDRLRFERWVRDATGDVRGRMQQYVTLLEGVTGLFSASEFVTRDEFKQYVTRLNLPDRYAGIRGVGYVKRVPLSDATEAQRLLREQRPDFTIWPLVSRRDYLTIAYLEPEDPRNIEALGYNMAIEPARRDAMERAAETGTAAATRKVTLIQEITAEKQPGFVVYVPIYRGDGVPATAEERQERLEGFAFSPFRSVDFLATVFPAELTQHVAVRIYDGPRTDAEALLYDSARGLDIAGRTRFDAVATFDIVGDRQWTMEVAALPTFGSVTFGWGITALTLLGGAGTTLLVFAVTHAIADAHRAAEAVTEQLRHSQRALMESDARLQLALDAGELFAFNWDVLTGTLALTGSAARILGATPPTAAAFFPLVHPDDRKQVRRTFVESSTGSPHAMEFRIIRPDGVERWLRERAVVQSDEAGGARRVVGMCADVTEQKHTEQQLRSLNETLEVRVADRTLESEQRTAQLRALAGELTQAEQRERRRLAQVLHDHLQQLLVAAMMRLGVMQGRAEAPPLKSQLGQIEELLRQAIESSRSLTVELSPPVLYDVGLAPGLEWLARSMQEKHRLTVELAIEPGADTPDEDLRAFLFQATRELLFNIVKHARVKTAEVRLTRSDDALHIAVADQGPGFDPAVLRVRGAKAEHFGLFSIQQRLELLGGRMRVESNGGLGTIITMSVPLTLARESPPEPHEVESEQHLAADKLLQSWVVTPDDGVIRVVVADDHEVLREGLAAMLEAQPDIKLVGEAADGEAAIELCRKLHPDAVVLDVTMPKLDGIEATRRIREACPGVVVIGLSMHEAQEVATAMRDAGASAYLTKSTPAEQLLDVLRSHCRRPEAAVRVDSETGV